MSGMYVHLSSFGGSTGIPSASQKEILYTVGGGGGRNSACIPVGGREIQLPSRYETLDPRVCISIIYIKTHQKKYHDSSASQVVTCPLA